MGILVERVEMRAAMLAVERSSKTPAAQFGTFRPHYRLRYALRRKRFQALLDGAGGAHPAKLAGHVDPSSAAAAADRRTRRTERIVVGAFWAQAARPHSARKRPDDAAADAGEQGDLSL
jgi:hypothetical protein